MVGPGRNQATGSREYRPFKHYIARILRISNIALSQHSLQVSISIQPATQTCNVINGTGTLSGADITNVMVTCNTDTYTVGGAISGLSGSVTLQNNGTDDLTMNADGSFTFANALSDGSAYVVTILSQPPLQSCNLTNGDGTITSADVTNVGVSCQDDSEVVVPAEPIPSLSAWGIGIMVGLFSILGVRRRRMT